MKVKHGGSNVISSQGVKSQGKFQIQASAHAFRILSSGLYSDKISAVLREIGCNAADSHIAAGCPDRPIEVKLPSSLDKDFYIKDYGIGLTHEDVTGLFTTYFSSNKSDTDEMTGAFGLGSKSPFSYTDSFAITVAKDGMQRSYTAHIGADGAPVISLLEVCPASEDWPSGMTVSFPVKPEDTREFHLKAAKVFSRFRVKPQILGGEPIPDIPAIIKGETFSFPEGREWEASVIMGNVAYPLNSSRLGITWQDVVETALISGSIQLMVPIGSAMPTASREELEYDPDTRANIRRALNEAALELARLLHAKTKSSYSTNWEWHKSIRDYARGLPSSLASAAALNRLLSLLGLSDAEIKETVDLYIADTRTLEPWVGNLISLPGPSATSTPVVDNTKSCEVWQVELYQRKSRFRAERRAIVSGRIKRGQADEKAVIKYDQRVEVIYADSTRAYQRIRKYLEDGNCDIVMMVGPYHKDTSKEAVRDYAHKLAQSLGGIAVKKTSVLPVPVAAKLARVKQSERAAAFAQAYASEEVSYIPITDDMQLNRENKIKIANVPKDGMFYVVPTQVRRSPVRFWMELPGKKTTKSLSEGELLATVKAYQGLYKHGMPLEKIGGFVVLDPGQLMKLKLKDNGFKALLETMAEQLSSEKSRIEFEQRCNRMPLVEDDYWAARHGGLLVALLWTKQRNKSVWKFLEPRLRNFPVLQGLFNELSAANDRNNPKAGIRLWLKDFLRCMPLDLNIEPQQLTAESLANMLKETYPLLEHFKHEDITNIREDAVDVYYAALERVLVPKDAIETVVEEKMQAAQSSAA